jgi:hypothetical protein
MVQILYTHVCKCKNEFLLKLFQEQGEKGIRRMAEGGEFKYDIFDIL